MTMARGPRLASCTLRETRRLALGARRRGRGGTETRGQVKPRGTGRNKIAVRPREFAVTRAAACAMSGRPQPARRGSHEGWDGRNGRGGRMRHGGIMEVGARPLTASACAAAVKVGGIVAPAAAGAGGSEGDPAAGAGGSDRRASAGAGGADWTSPRAARAAVRASRRARLLSSRRRVQRPIAPLVSWVCLSLAFSSVSFSDLPGAEAAPARAESLPTAATRPAGPWDPAARAAASRLMARLVLVAMRQDSTRRWSWREEAVSLLRASKRR